MQEYIWCESDFRWIRITFYGVNMEKTYGLLHQLYFVYLFLYFGSMIGVIAYAVLKKKVESYKYAGVLTVIVFFSISVWLIEQLIDWNFEFLSVSYIAGELHISSIFAKLEVESRNELLAKMKSFASDSKR